MPEGLSEDFKVEDFKGMLYDIIRVPVDRKLKTVFKDLGAIPEFNKRLPMSSVARPLDPDIMLRYVMYAYDRKSPLQRLPMNRRKIRAAELAAVPTYHGQYDKFMQQIFRCENVIVNAMIIRYCRMQYPRKFAFLVTGNEAFFNTLNELLNYKPQDEDILKQTELKGKIFNQVKLMVSHLDELASELLSGDTSQGLAEDLMRIAEGEITQKMSPEDYAFAE
jgi:hypothetical protein